MEDSRFISLLEALTRFIERIKWLRPFQVAEDPATLEEARGVLDEWALLEPHLELLEAVVGKQELAALQARVDMLRAQVRLEFLLAVGRLLQVVELRWMNELLMRVPAALKKLPAAEEQNPATADALGRLRSSLKEWPEPERMFRESMQAADNCESAVKTLHQKLLQDWPEEWTPEMESRFEHLKQTDSKAWREELRREAAELKLR